MPIENGDVMKVTWEYEVIGESSLMQNIYYWRITDLVSADPADVGQDFQTFIEDSLLAQISDFLASDYRGKTVSVINATKRERVFSSESTFAGTGVEDSSTSGQVAVEVLARGIATGHTGRKYFGPVTEASLTEGRLEPNALAAFQNLLDSWDSLFVGFVTTNSYEPGTASFAAGGALLQFRPFTDGLGQVVTVSRTQRSRTPGFGVG